MSLNNILTFSITIYLYDLSIYFVFVQLKIFLLDSGLGRPEFLSEGNGRIRRTTHLMQKLMELFYDFIIPGSYSKLI